jgi:hypothetical protein
VRNDSAWCSRLVLVVCWSDISDSVPCQDQSGDWNRLGHITREGAPVVRQLVAEAAWQALRRSPTVRAYFERAQRGDPQRKKIALVATAHYLARVMCVGARYDGANGEVDASGRDCCSECGILRLENV